MTTRRILLKSVMQMVIKLYVQNKEEKKKCAIVKTWQSIYVLAYGARSMAGICAGNPNNKGVNSVSC